MSMLPSASIASDYNIETKTMKMFAVLKANGQDWAVQAKYFRDPEDPSEVEDEKLPPHDSSSRFEASMKGEPTSWRTLKNRIIVTPSREYENPYERRLDHGDYKRNGARWNRELRELSKDLIFHSFFEMSNNCL